MHITIAHKVRVYNHTHTNNPSGPSSTDMASSFVAQAAVAAQQRQQPSVQLAAWQQQQQQLASASACALAQQAALVHNQQGSATSTAAMMRGALASGLQPQSSVWLIDCAMLDCDVEFHFILVRHCWQSGIRCSGCTSGVE
jgi:hypothetical protein